MPDEDIFYDQPSTDEAKQSSQGALNFAHKLIAVQRKLHAPKNQWNAFGKYSFRSCEDILEGLKPLLEEFGLLVGISDEIVPMDGRFYVKSTVTVIDADTGDSMSFVGWAREPENRKGADQSQVTGSSSSYARKYALNAAFLIDDNKDPDSGQGKQEQPKQEQQGQQGGFNAFCTNCGTRYHFADMAQYMGYVTANPCCQQPNWVVEQ